MAHQSLTIIETSIRRDAEGRYCLNDCHKASGGEPSKRPGEWLRNDQTKALIAELTDAEIPASPHETDAGIPASPVSSIKGGTKQGTYVAKELVYAYAMWINPKFHVQVIQAFDAMVTGKAQKKTALRVSGFSRTFEGLRKIAVRYLAMDNAQATLHAGHGTEVLHGFNPLSVLGDGRVESSATKVFYTVTQLAEKEGFKSAIWLNKIFEAMGLQTHTDNKDCSWLPTEAGRQYSRVVDNPIQGRRSTQSVMWSPDVVPMIRVHLGQAPGSDCDNGTSNSATHH